MLRGLLAQIETPQHNNEQAAEHVLTGFAELDVHPDVAEGMHKLAAAGKRLATLTNGAAETAGELLEGAGLADLVERFVSVDEVRRWKPAREPYLHAARELGVAPAECALVAVHPWDIDGAKRAGLQTGWLNRRTTTYPGFFKAPDATGEALGLLADALAENR